MCGIYNLVVFIMIDLDGILGLEEKRRMNIYVTGEVIDRAAGKAAEVRGSQFSWYGSAVCARSPSSAGYVSTCSFAACELRKD